MKTITFGIIGAGMITGDHLDALSQLKGTRVKWLSDIRSEPATLLAKKYNVSNTTSDNHALFSDPELDAIIIATPPFTHHAIFMEAVKTGKHILLEKPMGLTPQEVDSIVDAAGKQPDRVIIDASARHARLTPKFPKVREIIDSGILGDIYMIHHNAVYRHGRPGIEYHPTAKWFLERAKAGGGPLFDWGVYDLSFHLGVLSDTPELESVKTFMFDGLDAKDPGTDVFDVEEHGVAMMEFSGGLKYYWERAGHANMETPDETRIYGTRGGLKLSFLSWESPDIELYTLENEGRGDAVSETIPVDYSGHGGDGLELMKHFVELIRGTSAPILPLKVAARHMDILFRVYASAGRV